EAGLAGTARDYRDRIIGKLNFPSIDSEFTLINQSNLSVFVPLALSLIEDGEDVFTQQQLDFLLDLGVLPKGNFLLGEDVFKLYRQLIADRTGSFAYRKKNLKILQSIMAMYTFSLFSNSKFVQELISGGNREEYGYIYLTSYQDVYDYNLGLLD